jgi:hypothetical protein
MTHLRTLFPAHQILVRLRVTHSEEDEKMETPSDTNQKVVEARAVASVSSERNHRPDLKQRVAMTTQVFPYTREVYKVLAAQLGTTMGEMQIVALCLFLGKFRGPKAERRAIWEALRKGLPEANEIDD